MGVEGFKKSRYLNLYFEEESALKKPIKVNIFFLILILLQVFGGYLLRPIIKMYKLDISAALLMGQIMFLIVPVIIYFIVTRQSVKETLRFNKLKLRSAALVVVMGFLFIPVAAFLSYLTSFFFYNNVQDVFNKLKTLPLGLMIAIVAITPALCEEITMRGVVLSGYNKSKIWAAALINGFLFGVLHLNPPQFLYTFILGVMLAYVVRITNSIFASMIIHFIFNGTNTALAWINMKQSAATLKKSQEALNNSNIKVMMAVFLGIFAVVAVAAIITLMKELIKDNKENLNNVVLKPEGSVEVMFVKDKIIASVPVIISVVIYFMLVMKKI